MLLGAKHFIDFIYKRLFAGAYADMQNSSGGSDPRALTPPPPKRSRAGTLVYDAQPSVQKRERASSPNLRSPLWKKQGVTVKLVWDRNERLLEHGQPIVIGSKSDSTIVVHDKLVREKHVTLTIVKSYINLVTADDVAIEIDYETSFMTYKGSFSGELYTADGFKFSLYSNNACPIAARHINFTVVVDVEEED